MVAGQKGQPLFCPLSGVLALRWSVAAAPGGLSFVSFCSRESGLGQEKGSVLLGHPREMTRTELSTCPPPIYRLAFHRGGMRPILRAVCCLGWGRRADPRKHLGMDRARPPWKDPRVVQRRLEAIGAELPTGTPPGGRLQGCRL